MALSKADRIAFSLQIISAAPKISALNSAKAQLSGEIVKAQNLDTANSNLFASPNTLVNGYQAEAGALDGNGRTTISEQDVQDSANKKLQNHFFPNDTTVTVPSLSASHNIWTKLKPFALTYAIGKNYTEGYSTITKEGDLIQAVLTLITSASSHVNIENTSGQHATAGAAAHCTNPSFLTQSTCEAASATWIPTTTDQITSFPAVVTLKSDMVMAVNNLITFLNSEVAGIVTNDSNTGRQTQNSAAIANINSTFKPSLNTWLANPDFNPVPGTVTTFAQFYAYDSNLLAPTKLHSTQLTALTSALNARLSFITSRISQLTTNLGTIVQDLSTGEITSSSGLYGLRYGFLVLRLGALDGSLTLLAGMTATSGAQDSIISSTKINAATYASVVPTTLLQAEANGSSTIHVLDASAFSQGDSVFIFAEGQQELQRAIKSINNGAIVLNDSVPAKFRPSDGARMYRDDT